MQSLIDFVGISVKSIRMTYQSRCVCIYIYNDCYCVWRGGRGRAESAVGERVWRQAVIRRPSEWWLTPVFNSRDWWGDGYSSCDLFHLWRGKSNFGTQKAGLRDCVRQGASQEFVLNFIFVKPCNKSLVHSWFLTSSTRAGLHCDFTFLLIQRLHYEWRGINVSASMTEREADVWGVDLTI